MFTRRLLSILLIAFTSLTAIATTAASSAVLPEGKYSRTGFELDLADGHYLMRSFISYGMQAVEEGVYSLDGNKITFSVENGSQVSLAGCGSSFTYTYLWTFDPATSLVSLSPFTEPCQARQSDLTRSPLSYSGISSSDGIIPVTGQQVTTLQGLPDGEFIRNGFELDLQQGHYMLRSFVSYGMQTIEKGNFTLSGNKISFVGTNISQAVRTSCGDSVGYVYNWVYDPFIGVLNLKPLNDTCQARQSDMTRAPLILR